MIAFSLLLWQVFTALCQLFFCPNTCISYKRTAVSAPCVGLVAVILTYRASVCLKESLVSPNLFFLTLTTSVQF